MLTVQTGRDKEHHFNEADFPSYLRLKHSFTTSTMVLVFENHWKKKAQAVLSGKIPKLWITLYGSTLHLNTGVEPIDLTELVETLTTRFVRTGPEGAPRV